MKTVSAFCLLVLFLGFGNTGTARCAPFKLQHNMSEELDRFGLSCSVSGDYAVIGSSRDQEGSSFGAAFIYKKSGDSWELLSQLINGNRHPRGSWVGRSVSISGDYVIVGAALEYNDLEIRSGSAYIFQRSGDNWFQMDRLTALDGERGDTFGENVSISGDYAIIGAWRDDDLGASSGSAYIFQRVGSSWVQRKKLIPADGAKGDHFGYSVSISGDYAIVGAYNNDDDNPSGYGGSVYFFKRSGLNWVQTDKISADAWNLKSKIFGLSVSISGDYAIIGDGLHMAYICQRIGESWIPIETLTASNIHGHEDFGGSVSIHGDYAVVGSVLYHLENNVQNSSDSSYVYKRDGDSWKLVKKIVSPESNKKSQFGSAVSISNKHVLIGAPGGDGDNTSIPGAAYMYKISDINAPPEPPPPGNNSATFSWLHLLLKK